MDSLALISLSEQTLASLWENLRSNGANCEYGENDSIYLTLTTENVSLRFTVSMDTFPAADTERQVTTAGNVKKENQRTAQSVILQIYRLLPESTDTLETK
jgi:hypothetical protein